MGWDDIPRFYIKTYSSVTPIDALTLLIQHKNSKLGVATSIDSWTAYSGSYTSPDPAASQPYS